MRDFLFVTSKNAIIKFNLWWKYSSLTYYVLLTISNIRYIILAYFAEGRG